MSRRRSRVFLKRYKKKSLVTAQEDLNSRLVSANLTLMAQIEEHQWRYTAQSMEQQRRQGKILRDLMVDWMAMGTSSSMF